MSILPQHWPVVKQAEKKWMKSILRFSRSILLVGKWLSLLEIEIIGRSIDYETQKVDTPIRYYIALLCHDIQIKVICNYCRYGITDSTLKGTVVISWFDRDPSSPILEIDPLFKIRYISPLYHNNSAK